MKNNGQTVFKKKKKGYWKYHPVALSSTGTLFSEILKAIYETN